MRQLFVLFALTTGCVADTEDDTAAGDGKADGQGPCAGCDLLGYCANDTHKDSCMLDADSRWKVVAVRAKISADNEGAAWDLGGGAPDPYVLCLRAGVEAGRTAVADNTLTPSWNAAICEANGAELMRNDLSVRVYDEDDLSADNFIGLFRAQVSLDDLNAKREITRTLYSTTVFDGALTRSQLTLRFDRAN